MGFQIERIVLRQIHMPLVHFFETSFSRTYERDIVLVEAIADGVSGWGEITCGENPFYNEEWTESAWLIARDYAAPRVLKHNFEQRVATSPRGRRIFAGIRWRAAESRSRCGIWRRGATAFRSRNRSAAAREPRFPAASRSAFRTRFRNSSKRFDTEVDAGYQRIKMKIKPGWDVDVIREVREAFPNILLMADANSAYTLADVDRLKQLGRIQSDDDRAAAGARRNHRSRRRCRRS